MTGSDVRLYLYDLSNGLAAQMSLSLTGKTVSVFWLACRDVAPSLALLLLNISVGTVSHASVASLTIIDSSSGKYIPAVW